MQNLPIIETRHPETSTVNLQHVLADYPVPLLTRRSFSLNAERIVEERQNAPQPLRRGDLSGRRRPPN